MAYLLEQPAFHAQEEDARSAGGDIGDVDPFMDSEDFL